MEVADAHTVFTLVCCHQFKTISDEFKGICCLIIETNQSERDLGLAFP